MALIRTSKKNRVASFARVPPTCVLYTYVHMSLLLLQFWMELLRVIYDAKQICLCKLTVPRGPYHVKMCDIIGLYGAVAAVVSVHCLYKCNMGTRNVAFFARPWYFVQACHVSLEFFFSLI